MDVDALAVAMAADHAQGLLPTVVVANVGSISSGAIDPVRAMGEECQRYNTNKQSEYSASIPVHEGWAVMYRTRTLPLGVW